MRWSRTFIPTLRDDPAGTPCSAVRRLVRGGFLRRVEPTGYMMLPLLMRVIDRLQQSVIEALTGAGGCRVELISALPDRGGVAATHHEQGQVSWRGSLLSFVRRELRSYRQLPLVFFSLKNLPGESVSGGEQVFGVRRLVSQIFCRDDDSLSATLTQCEAAACSALKACGLTVSAVLAGSGHRCLFVPSASAAAAAADEGVFGCAACGYRATDQAAACRPPVGTPPAMMGTPTAVSTPGMRTVEEVTAFLQVPARQLVKTLLHAGGDEVFAALVRGDRSLSERKLRQALGGRKLALLEASRIRQVTGAEVGFSGPVGLSGVRIIADHEIPLMRNFVVGGNVDDVHLVDVNPRDFAVAQVADLRCATDGDGCPQCAEGRLHLSSGFALARIECPRPGAHAAVFFDDENGAEREACVGRMSVDLSAVLQAITEQHQDGRGFLWPPAIAPFDVYLMPINPDDDAQRAAAERLESALHLAGLEVLHDDRAVRPGVRFYDADLTGIPWRVVLGPQRLAAGDVEITCRATGRMEVVKLAEAIDYLRARAER